MEEILSPNKLISFCEEIGGKVEKQDILVCRLPSYSNYISIEKNKDGISILVNQKELFIPLYDKVIGKLIIKIKPISSVVDIDVIDGDFSVSKIKTVCNARAIKLRSGEDIAILEIE